MTAPLTYLFTHAHPDDETINNGATICKLLAQGNRVAILTSTRGEEGEVLVPELAMLASNQEDRLGEHREIEIARAMKILGVTDHRFLGGSRNKYRDSGMIGTPPNQRKDNFWQADFETAVEDCVKEILDIKPDVVITYDEYGGYGHPDHIQTHRVTMAAIEKVKPDWEVKRVYWCAMPRSLMEKGLVKLKEKGVVIPGMESAAELDFLTDDELVTTHINAEKYAKRKIIAMLEHRTQITQESEFFMLARALGEEVFGHEYYRLVKGELSSHLDSDGMEISLAGDYLPEKN